jgi:hypothetical protein
MLIPGGTLVGGAVGVSVGGGASVGGSVVAAVSVVAGVGDWQRGRLSFARQGRRVRSGCGAGVTSVTFGASLATAVELGDRPDVEVGATDTHPSNVSVTTGISPADHAFAPNPDDRIEPTAGPPSRPIDVVLGV